MDSPQPLTQLPKQNIQGLAFDVDDTLTQYGKLQSIAFSAMWRLHEAGFKLVPVTGRPSGWAEVMIQHWPVDLVVAENGASWVKQTSEGTQTSFFETEKTRNQFQKVWRGIQQTAMEHVPHVRISPDQHMRTCDLAFETGTSSGVSEDDKNALCKIILESGARPIHSSIHTHAHLGEFDKALGFKKAIQEVFGKTSLHDLDAWVFIGDSTNDAPMFEAFKNSVGVKNVQDFLPQLTSKPKFITEESHGAGFAELANHLLMHGPNANQDST